MIEIKNLTKSYRIKGGRHYVFKNANAVFPTGANIGIIGPNGGGKSTFLRILGGIDHPDSGEIISNVNFSWPLGLKSGFVSHLSGRDNCRMVCNLYGIDYAQIGPKLEQMKQLSGIGKYFEEKVKYYSSGMSGRVGFALSMSFDFDYFLVDEVTSVGDAHFKALAKKAFEEKAKTSKLIMVSHNMGDIKKFCDIVVLVKNGNIEVFTDMDRAIRAYMPQTKESIQDVEETLHEAKLEELDIANVQLPDLQKKYLAEITSRLSAIQLKIASPNLTITGGEDDFYFKLATVYFSLGDHKQARDHFLKAIASNPYHIQSQQRLAAMASANGDREEEDRALRMAEAADPLNVATLTAKIQSQLRTRQLNDALATVDLALRVKPTNSALWSLRSKIFMVRGETQNALQSQVKALHHSPNSGRLYQQLSTILAANGEIEASVVARHKAFTLQSNNRSELRPPAYAAITRILRILDQQISV